MDYKFECNAEGFRCALIGAVLLLLATAFGGAFGVHSANNHWKIILRDKPELVKKYQEEYAAEKARIEVENQK